MFEAVLTHYEAHFNETACANIPEYWECELVELPNHLLGDRFEHIHIYGTSQDSAQDSVDDLISQMKNNGWTGKLKLYQ